MFFIEIKLQSKIEMNLITRTKLTILFLREWERNLFFAVATHCKKKNELFH